MSTITGLPVDRPGHSHKSVVVTRSNIYLCPWRVRISPPQSCLTTTCSRTPTNSSTTSSTLSQTSSRRRRARSDSRTENWCRTGAEEADVVTKGEAGVKATVGRGRSRRGSTRSSRERWPTRRAASTAKLWAGFSHPLLPLASPCRKFRLRLLTQVHS